MVDDHVLDCDQHQKDNYTDDVVASHDKSAKGLDDFTSGRSSSISFQENEPRRGNIQRQPE